mmetsp:Transcript_836/g.3257  ORF Transcript_836/g.3257 Transcript_836/m.3257 type:complete len:203 (+) Transcript_836:1209-1817(+)
MSVLPRLASGSSSSPECWCPLSDGEGDGGRKGMCVGTTSSSSHGCLSASAAGMRSPGSTCSSDDTRFRAPGGKLNHLALVSRHRRSNFACSEKESWMVRSTSPEDSHPRRRSSRSVGSSPVSISKIMTPADHRSQRPSYSRDQTSGAMYAGVPHLTWSGEDPGGWAIAIPKSPSLMGESAWSTRRAKLSGFRSLWTMLRAPM